MARTNTITGGSGPGFTGVTVDDVTVFGDGLNVPLHSTFNQSGKDRVSGGAVYSGTGYVYDVSTLVYYFDGPQNLLTSAPTQVTFAPGDATYDRVDAIVVDEAGTVSIIQGTPAINPLYPIIPEDQLAIQYELVKANAVVPTVNMELIHGDEPTTNWTALNYTTSGTPVGSTNFSATNGPFQGLNYINNIRDSRTGDRFVRTASFDISQYTVFCLRMRFTGTVPANSQVAFRWENGAGTQIGSSANVFTYGASRTLLNTWQLVFIPVSVFGAITLVKGLKSIMTGLPNGTTKNWQIDYMFLTDGSVPVTNQPVTVFEKDGVLAGSSNVENFVTTPSIVPSVINDLLNNRMNISFTGPLSYFPTGNNAGSIFAGVGAGQGATFANDSVFLGNNAGLSAISADHSVFIGTGAGSGAYNANNSLYLGHNAGSGNTNGQNMIGIGYNSGAGDTSAAGNNVLIGYDTHAASFDRSVVIGVGTSPLSATASGQVLFDPLLTRFTIRGVDYIMPTIAPTTGQVLTFNGTQLVWA